MSDQYVPNNPANPASYGTEAERRARDLPPVQQTVSTSSGWGTGMAVAIVIVILALVGFAMFSGGPSTTSTVPATTPDVTIQNSAPDAGAAPDQGVLVPDATIPDATIAPDTGAIAPDATIPDATAPDTAAPAPDAAAPDATAPAPDAGATATPDAGAAPIAPANP